METSQRSSLERSRLLAVSAPKASYWLNALPSTISSLASKMDNSPFKIVCALRLGSVLDHSH